MSSENIVSIAGFKDKKKRSLAALADEVGKRVSLSMQERGYDAGTANSLGGSVHKAIVEYDKSGKLMKLYTSYLKND
jgi:hypothetical protein